MTGQKDGHCSGHFSTACGPEEACDAANTQRPTCTIQAGSRLVAMYDVRTTRYAMEYSLCLLHTFALLCDARVDTVAHMEASQKWAGHI